MQIISVIRKKTKIKKREKLSDSNRHILDSNDCVLKVYISSSSGTSKAEESRAEDNKG